MLTAPEIRATVHQKINDLLAEAELPTRDMSGAELLNEIALNSLLLARLVIELEMEFGVDPFEEEYVISDVRTVDALADVYVQVLGKAETSAV
ncbi:hypothetical protein RKE29_15680 [Streptomyces sp. B1866]|uniref:hypothetical protein n=1 Tax=Streptomyces sp. B1866 TaxID=3075431 RepID=UPI00288D0937|nr:hypothetical protein [Streptomyces sp. B1866]MDT3398065.1 hypothetical protein [Streptomyces sp. B1866]